MYMSGPVSVKVCLTRRKPKKVKRKKLGQSYQNFTKTVNGNKNVSREMRSLICTIHLQ